MLMLNDEVNVLRQVPLFSCIDAAKLKPGVTEDLGAESLPLALVLHGQEDDAVGDGLVDRGDQVAVLAVEQHAQSTQQGLNMRCQQAWAQAAKQFPHGQQRMDFLGRKP